jgi:hypothetical protein
MTQAVLPFMLRQKSGTIVNVAPPTAIDTDGSWGGSLATKFALIGFTETVRSEVRDSGLTLSLVLPDGVPYGRNGNGAANLPPGWVAAATILAAKFRLADISIPPSPATVEAIRSAAPRAADAVSGWVSAAQRLFNGANEDDEASRRLPGELLRFAVH